MGLAGVGGDVAGAAGAGVEGGDVITGAKAIVTGFSGTGGGLETATGIKLRAPSTETWCGFRPGTFWSLALTLCWAHS